jgi:lantibiotic modifying enzyme
MKLSNEQLSAIAAMGSFLPERLQGMVRFNPAPACDTVCQERYQLWQTKAGGNGGEQAFLKRLALDGISPGKAMEIMAEPAWNPKLPFPEWVKDLQAILELFPFNSEEMNAKLFFTKEAEIIPNNDMIDAVLPLVYYAEQRLQKKLGAGGGIFAKSAFSNLSASLVKALSMLCFQTFRYRFRIYMSAKNPLVFFMGTTGSQEETRQNWREFTNEALAGGWPEILAEYPVLARLITTVINQWVNNVTELVNFLTADARELEILFFSGETLGTVIGVTADISDAHNQGKCVYILEFETGKKVVFKPRSLKIDQIWGRLLKWINEKEIPTTLLTPRVLDLNDHGWMEYIQNNPLKDQAAAQRFYFRTGVVIGLVYALGGNDFHRENLIAWGEHPALIDTETLLLHRVKPFQLDPGGFNAGQKALDFLSDSTLRTGFFPFWKTSAPGEPPDDIGALTGKSDGWGNLPILDGQYLNVTDYQEQLVEGFRWLYNCLIRHRSELLGPESPLKHFAACKFRFLIRTSQIYGDMLRHTAGPEFLKDGLIFSLEIERLAAAFLLSAPGDVLPKVWRIFQSESEALHRRDIPIFYGEAETLGLMDGTTSLYDGYFMQSAIDRAKELIGKFDQDDQRIQLDLIENSLGIYDQDSHAEVAAAVTDEFPELEEIHRADNEQLIGEAHRIYDQMLAKRIIGYGGDATWIVQQYDMTTQKLALGRIGLPLYDGVLGLVLFMAALYRLTKEAEIKDNALKCIQSFREALYDQENPFPIHRVPLGLGSGMAGLFTVMMSLAFYLDEASLVDDVRYLLHKIQPAQIEADQQYDVISGAAGLILTLTKFGSRIQDEKILELARQCGQQLLSGRVKAESGHRVWRSGIENAPLTGMGHGAAGIACALLKLYEFTGDQEYFEAAKEAIDYETTLYDPQKLNWPDLRKNPHQETVQKAFMTGWCSGAPGIGLARVANFHLVKTPAIIKDINNAINFTLQYPMYSNDHLCCGNSGRIDFLIEAGLKLERPDLLEEARKRAGWMINRKEIKGQYTFNTGRGKVFNPSFFQGTAGIGYELLRCVAPELIFSILD